MLGLVKNSTQPTELPVDAILRGDAQPVELFQEILVGYAKQIAYAAHLPADRAPGRNDKDIAARPFELVIVAGDAAIPAVNGVDAVSRRLRLVHPGVRGQMTPFDAQAVEVGWPDHDLAQAGAAF